MSDESGGGGVGEATRSLTYGEKAVGLTFNPSNNKKVQDIKELYGKIIDLCNNEVPERGEMKNFNIEQVRLFKIAITQAQQAQMWAVKAITWNINN